jgi:hypothetical protein
MSWDAKPAAAELEAFFVLHNQLSAEDLHLRPGAECNADEDRSSLIR